MNKKLLPVLFLFSCALNFAQVDPKTEIGELLNSWHNAATTANFEEYFSKMSENSVFIGTDATEHWTYNEFKTFAKPYFERGKAWSFTGVSRNIFISDDHNFAWFDELLDTQMKLCRGSGVLKNEKGTWKIVHYVLSIAIPNEDVSEIVEIKKDFDNILLKKIQESKHK
ncbi:nuclear transport factor 2 family protein [Abyssalbus ytuae]|uniref:Nuclear transport factor 2 family protein n=1 Tax=Abyssalbus ytuae TaxID=2926907 RepID=A0A9E6ZID8_9FLAO|nr:nuclear transport factor 2 family protein [Abyssalbus ytuae]UOB16082.1 nuclear transport factor 2 family protein [Abyssalbus ytuae]